MSRLRLRFQIICISIILGLGYSQAQDTNSEGESAPEISLMGFVDTYYAFDFNEPTAGTARQPFLYHFNRHNEFNVNLALVKLSVNHSKYRANIALQSGNYAVDNYAAENSAMRSINEANAGLALDKEGKLWLDVGVFPSHLGFASALSIENPVLSRSLVAENSPYFLSGAKISYETGNLTLTGTVTNGWQRINRVFGNSRLSYGTQVFYEFSETVSLNWSTFIGTEDPDNFSRDFIFNNFYAIITPSDQWMFIAGLDHGLREELPNSSEYDNWTGITGIAQYKFSEELRFAGRFEYYNDPTGVIIDPTGDGVQLSGISANFDYYPTPMAALRFETRYFSDPTNIFERNGDAVGANFTFLASLAVKLEKFWNEN